MKTWHHWIIASFLLALGAMFPTIDAHSQSSHGQHGDMQHQAPSGTFEHRETVEDIRTEFQVMSLASMNMTDPGGATHHVMVRFLEQKNDEPIADAIGKVKVIAPDGREQVETLQNYNGTFAANFKIEQTGKYGVICLFKAKGKQHVVKFWYPHGES
ncbi:MAG TPA: hypothetical protein ACFCUC_18470 [Desulfobacterales bacterium]